MKRSLSKPFLAIAVLSASALAARDSAAIQITLNLVQADSHVTLGGDFGGIPFAPQDVDPPGAGGAIPAGVVDYNAATPSLRTSFQGTVVVDVDNVNSPSSIQILSSNADADLSGEWLPEVQPFLDIDMDGNFGEFGDDSLTASSDAPQPPAPADWGFRNIHPAFGVDVAYGAVRDLNYNVTSPVIPVAGGLFSSLTENFEFATGWLDYWVAPAAGNLRGRAELAGGDDDNQSVLMSSYVVTALPGNQREIKLTLPIFIDAPGGDANFRYEGQFVATVTVPEPTSFVLCGLAMAFASGFVVRRRK